MAFPKKAREERLTSLTMRARDALLDLCARQSRHGGCASVCGSLRASVACRDCRERDGDEKSGISSGSREGRAQLPRRVGDRETSVSGVRRRAALL